MASESSKRVLGAGWDPLSETAAPKGGVETGTEGSVFKREKVRSSYWEAMDTGLVLPRLLNMPLNPSLRAAHQFIPAHLKYFRITSPLW